MSAAWAIGRTEAMRDPEKTVETVNRLLNPYTREMSLDDMNIAKAQSYR